jgi:excinuclease ABC subunit C
VPQLFTEAELTTFGPSRYLPGAEPPLHRIDGSRSRTLRGLVRRDAPRRPGVYGMLNEDGEIIYVGKAKSLRNRLLSYFRCRSRDPKAGHIIARSRSLIWEFVPNEFTALLRELELIRRWRPRFNWQGQPDRDRYSYLCVGRPPAACLFIARQPPKNTLAVFGPIRPLRRYHEAVRFLNQRFRLRDCPSRQPMHFADAPGLFDESLRPGCLRLDLGTCLAPCAGQCTSEEYGDAVGRALAFLQGNDQALFAEMEAEMAKASDSLAFEQAASLRDQLENLRRMLRFLQRLREAQERPAFVYESASMKDNFVWQVIHSGRIMMTVQRPETANERRRVERAIRETIAQRGPAPVIVPAELDELLLIAAWFRKHPEEWERTRRID